MTEAAIRRLFMVLWVLAMSASSLWAGDIAITGSLPFGATFTPNVWTPVRVEVRNNSERDVSGTVCMIFAQAGAPEYRTALDVGSHGRAETVLWVLVGALDKKNSVARLTFNDVSGAVVSRGDVTAVPFVSTKSLPNGLFESGTLVDISGDTTPPEQCGLEGMEEVLSTLYGVRGWSVSIMPEAAPSARTPYDGAYVVQLRGVDPNVLAPSQRQAIMDYVCAGGVLLISAPDAAVVNASWLQPLLPVKLLGNREMKQVPSPYGGQPLAFRKYLPCSEAQRADGVVLIADEQYVHAAYRKFGLGRIVYISFPASSLDWRNEQTTRLWRELLGALRPPVGAAGSALEKQYPQLMASMLGRRAASWAVAATAVGGLSGLVLVSHLLWRGASRRRAFEVTLAASIVMAGAFWILAFVGQRSEPLQEARLTIVDASDEGALVNEYAAASGAPQVVQRTVVDPDSSIYPSLTRQEAPLVSEWPVTVDRIDVRPQQLSLITLATRVDRPLKAHAAGRFTAEGLTVSVNNELGLPLTSAQLLWGPYRVSLPSIAPGKTVAVVGDAQVRPADEFTAASGVTEPSEQQRGDILKASLESVSEKQGMLWPAVIGWTTDWPAASRLSTKPDGDVSQALVRIPVEIQPSPVGKVRVDGVFNKLIPGETSGLPYDRARSRFVQSSLSGAWTLAIEPPIEIGTLHAETARLNIDLQVPQCGVTIRKGQCRDGKLVGPGGNASGEVVAQWNGPVGVQSVQFACTAADLDAHGRLWLLLEVKGNGQGGTGADQGWRIGRLLVDIEGQVVTGETK